MPMRYNVREAEGETAMDINDKAPAFSLPDQNGKEVSLKLSERPNNNFAYPAYFVLKAE